MTKTPLQDIKTSEQARQLAINWQAWASEQDMSYFELMEWASYFDDIADKFKLNEEFRENGII